METNNPEVGAEVTDTFRCYEVALVGNDVPVLDELFWGSPHVLRYGAWENLYGTAKIAALRSGRPSQGLERELTRTVITTFGRDFATANTEFRCPGVAKVGRQCQSWAQLPEGWRVVTSHVSFMA